MMACRTTSKASYKYDCGPFAPEVYRLPFPNFTLARKRNKDTGQLSCHGSTWSG
jgi:hypothetical protein